MIYRAENDLPSRNSGVSKSIMFRPISKVLSDTEDLESMTREELLREVIRTRINEAWAKIYAVKGDGTTGLRVDLPDAQAIPRNIRKYGGDALIATFMPRKPLANEKKAWQAYSAGQASGLPTLPFSTPSEAHCQADR